MQLSAVTANFPTCRAPLNTPRPMGAEAVKEMANTSRSFISGGELFGCL